MFWFRQDIIFSRAFSSAPEPEVHHYTDFDCKVIDYMSRLERQDDIKTYVSEAKHSRLYIEMTCSLPARTVIINIKVTLPTLHFKG